MTQTGFGDSRFGSLRRSDPPYVATTTALAIAVRSIVSYREEHGPFRTRAVLKKVPRLGRKAFELSAGFLRIRNGDDPLDASGVHPEAYPVVRRKSSRI